MKRWNKTRSIALLALVAGLLIGTLFNGGVRAAGAAAAPDATPLTIPNPVQLSNAFSKLAKQLEPSVVLVTSTMEQKAARRGGRGSMPFEGDEGDMLRRFFGFGEPDLPRRPFRSQATGSGFIVDRNGYIMTNNHVVDGATRVQVKLHDVSTQYTAKVVGTDPELDLAVLKIDAARPLPAVKIGNSDSVQVGDWAVAIGSPFGLEATVTAGIISAKGRDLGDRDHQLQRFLQTDAAINPGNSGGPLLDIDGDVIGINTMIATNTGSFEGIGFALPMNLAVNAYNQIIKTGKVSRGAIGILFTREQKPELLKVYGATQGVFVQQVTPGTPADKAGMREGDVITTFDGKPVKNGDDLVAMVSETPVGARVPVTVLREGKKVELNLQIGDRSQIVARDSGRDQAAPGGSDRGAGQAVKFGISVQDIRPSDRRTADLPSGGVVVTAVDGGSFAEDIGLREGDVVTAINRQPVNSVDDVKRIAASLKPGDAVAFKVLRNSAAGPGGGRGADWATLYAAGTLPNS